VDVAYAVANLFFKAKIVSQAIAFIFNFNFLHFKLAKYHSHGGPLGVSITPYIGLGEDWIKAGEEIGYNRTDLQAEYTEGNRKLIFFYL